MAEDISEDFDEIEKALVTIQTYIRRYYALAKYHQLRTHNLFFRILFLSCPLSYIFGSNRTIVSIVKSQRLSRSCYQNSSCH
jgi:hypothetical protein